MRTRFEKGSGIEEILILVGLAIVIFFIILPGDYPALINSTGSSAGNTSKDSPSDGSIYAKYVGLSSGTASSATEPHIEYVVITNNMNVAINIDDWKLMGSRGEVTITKGSTLTPSTRSRNMETVILQPGETAIVTTGPLDTNAPHVKSAPSDKTWFVFADKSFEMWSKDYETIRLYDKWGKLVTSISY